MSVDQVTDAVDPDPCPVMHRGDPCIRCGASGKEWVKAVMAGWETWLRGDLTTGHIAEVETRGYVQPPRWVPKGETHDCSGIDGDCPCHAGEGK